jgi:hypothetical protein
MINGSRYMRLCKTCFPVKVTSSNFRLPPRCQWDPLLDPWRWDRQVVPKRRYMLPFDAAQMLLKIIHFKVSCISQRKSGGTNTGKIRRWLL